MAEKGRVNVAVRIRPLLPTEISRGCNEVLCYPVNNQIAIGERSFSYDFVFPPSTRQNDVYEKAVFPLLEKCIEGYNITVMAYGQTGSGKTYTMGSSNMSGVLEQQGVIPRFLYDVFQRIEQLKSSKKCCVKASFLEIYGEDIFDLLNDENNLFTNFRVGTQVTEKRKSLNVREDETGVFVSGLIQHSVYSMEDALECLRKGSMARSTASTCMNDQSSRSHAVFTLTIEQSPLFSSAVGDNEQANPSSELQGVTTSKLTFVDLAGSERLKKTLTTGIAMREGININVGLLALGNVINALADVSRSTQTPTNTKIHIPYRDSKLTRLLQDALGGNSQTLFIACASPADFNSDETLNTLRYANRAKNIKNKAVVNRDPISDLVSKMRATVWKLQVELIHEHFPELWKTFRLDENTSLLNDSQDKRRVKALLDHNDVKTYLQQLIGDGFVFEDTELNSNTALSLVSNLDESKKETHERQDFRCSAWEAELHSQENCSDLGEKGANKYGDDQKNDMNEMDSEDALDDLIVDDDDLTLLQELLDVAQKEEEHSVKEAVALQQVRDVESQIAVKERLVQKLQETVKQYKDIKEQYDTLLSTVHQLENERETLLMDLEKLEREHSQYENNSTAAKLTKAQLKLKQITEQLTKLKDQQHAKAEIIRKAEQEAKKVNQLNLSIQKLKNTKVQLMRRQKEDSSKHQRWLTEKNREIQTLRKKARQFQNQISRMQVRNRCQEMLLSRRGMTIDSLARKLKLTQHQMLQMLERRNRITAQKSHKINGQRKDLPENSTLDVNTCNDLDLHSSDEGRWMLDEAVEYVVRVLASRCHISRLVRQRNQLLLQISDLVSKRKSLRIELNETVNREKKEAEGIDLSLEQIGLESEAEAARLAVEEEMRDVEMQLESLEGMLSQTDATIEEYREELKSANTDFESENSHEKILDTLMVTIDRVCKSSRSEEVCTVIKPFFEELVQLRTQHSLALSRVSDAEREAEKFKEEAEEWKSRVMSITSQVETQMAELRFQYQEDVVRLMKLVKVGDSHQTNELDNTEKTSSLNRPPESFGVENTVGKDRKNTNLDFSTVISERHISLFQQQVSRLEKRKIELEESIEIHQNQIKKLEIDLFESRTETKCAKEELTLLRAQVECLEDSKKVSSEISAQLCSLWNELGIPEEERARAIEGLSSIVTEKCKEEVDTLCRIHQELNSRIKQLSYEIDEMKNILGNPSVDKEGLDQDNSNKLTLKYRCDKLEKQWKELHVLIQERKMDRESSIERVTFLVEELSLSSSDVDEFVKELVPNVFGMNSTSTKLYGELSDEAMKSWQSAVRSVALIKAERLSWINGLIEEGKRLREELGFSHTKLIALCQEKWDVILNSDPKLFIKNGSYDLEAFSALDTKLVECIVACLFKCGALLPPNLKAISHLQIVLHVMKQESEQRQQKIAFLEKIYQHLQQWTAFEIAECQLNDPNEGKIAMNDREYRNKENLALQEEVQWCSHKLGFPAVSLCHLDAVIENSKNPKFSDESLEAGWKELSRFSEALSTQKEQTKEVLQQQWIDLKVTQNEQNALLNAISQNAPVNDIVEDISELSQITQRVDKSKELILWWQNEKSQYERRIVDSFSNQEEADKNTDDVQSETQEVCESVKKLLEMVELVDNVTKMNDDMNYREKIILGELILQCVRLHIVAREMRHQQVKIQSIRNIMSLINQIHDLDQKMEEFENKASDKTRLFTGRSTDRLNEEKFRKKYSKTYPKLIYQIKKQIWMWEKREGQEFNPELLGEKLHQVLEGKIMRHMELLHLSLTGWNREIVTVDSGTHARVQKSRLSNTSQTEIPTVVTGLMHSSLSSDSEIATESLSLQDKPMRGSDPVPLEPSSRKKSSPISIDSRRTTVTNGEATFQRILRHSRSIPTPIQATITSPQRSDHPIERYSNNLNSSAQKSLKILTTTVKEAPAYSLQRSETSNRSTNSTLGSTTKTPIDQREKEPKEKRFNEKPSTPLVRRNTRLRSHQNDSASNSGSPASNTRKATLSVGERRELNPSYSSHALRRSKQSDGTEAKEGFHAQKQTNREKENDPQITIIEL